MNSQSSTLATFILPIAKALRLAGGDPMELLEQAEIDPASVINNDRRIPVEKMRRLWQLAGDATGDEAFGLLAAEQMQPATLQSLGLAVLASDTVYDALRRLVRFSRMLSTGLHCELIERGEFVELVLVDDMDEVDSETVWYGYDFGVGVVLSICRQVLGEYVSPAFVECQRPAPANPDRFAALLGCPVSFAAAHNRIAYVHADIVDQLVTANPQLARVNDEQAQLYLDSFLDVSTRREVIGKIVEHLPDGPPSQKKIADALHLSNRTLQRKLKEEGTSFIDLLQEARLQLARKYLAEPRRSILETAYLLGFSEPSTFSRAFKRWTGQSPQDYRQSGHSRSAET